MDGKTRYSFSEHLQGAKSTWEEATRSNALFLSTAVLLNSEQLRAIYQWFNDSFVVLGGGGKLPIDFSTRFLEEPKGAELVVDFLRSADFGICGARAIRREGFEHEFSFTSEGPASGARRRQEFLLPQFAHEADSVRADFDFPDESEGTMKMFSLAAPPLDIMANGKTLVVDELDNSLHPLLVRQIVKTFNDNRNAKGAQLIFTSHDTSLLDSGLMRRQEFLLPQFTHEADSVRADFDFPDESEGTMKMFSLAAPLLDIMANGKTLVVDELDNSLHPLLVRQIVKTFNDNRNAKGAQLIFTSHDTSLLDSGLMRRDQFWLVKKNRRQSSEVVPLTEFSPRKSEALERGYLSGRYGGIPVLSKRLVTGSREDE